MNKKRSFKTINQSKKDERPKSKKSKIENDFKIATNQYPQFINLRSNNNKFHHYYSFVSLKNAISQTVLIDIFNIYDEIIIEICNYHGITDWSNKEKSEKFSIVDSNDNTIRYVLLTHPPSVQYTTNSILFNDANWIDIDSNFIYQYIFKINQNQAIGGSHLYVAIVTQNYNFPLKCDRIAQEERFECYSVGSPFIDATTSLSWETDGYVCSFRYRGNTYENAWDTFNKKSYLYDKQYPFDFFMLQINLIEKKLKIYCNELANEDKFIECNFPSQWLTKETRINIAINIGRCNHSQYKWSKNSCLGIGFMKNN